MKAFIAFLSLFFTGYSAPIVEMPVEEDRVSWLDAQMLIEERAEEAIGSIAEKNMESFAALVHTDLGVRFSPYSFVSERDVILNASEIERAFDDTTIYDWGSYDGSGLPIELTFSQFYDEFIYEVDFNNAPEVYYDNPVNFSNTINSVTDYYPDSIVVEYHFPGFESEFEGIDWRSLYLIFEEKEEVWYVVGIGNGRWTI